MKKIVLFALGLVVSATTLAQEKEKINTAVAADFVNQYIWRGQDLGSTAIQPTLGVSYKGLSLTAWGSMGLTDSEDTKELDPTLAYTIGGLNIGVPDYWFNKGGLTRKAGISSTTPMEQTTFLRPTSAMTSVSRHCSGSLTLRAVTAQIKMTRGPIAVISK